MHHKALTAWGKASTKGLEHEAKHFEAHIGELMELKAGVDSQADALRGSHCMTILDDFRAVLLHIFTKSAGANVANTCNALLYGDRHTKARAEEHLVEIFTTCAHASIAHCVAVNWWVDEAASLTAGAPHSLDSMERVSAFLDRTAKALKAALRAVGVKHKSKAFKEAWRAALHQIETHEHTKAVQLHEEMLATRLYHAGVVNLKEWILAE